ncbi:kinase-like protein [Lophiostoma macrostomum CBS 122681]|uniref:non-specific serine/threonine protein kinase n=1 Tax=Lophiostoma macrostomum CBS 122681 TaxID=1314788 RepID=A0A6A6T5Z7_9PLEO|nr:kinase-like protein [Lophiostoma macrostomum CBS 122681]
MSGGFRPRPAQFDWVDCAWPSIRLSPSPTRHSKITAAVKQEEKELSFLSPPQVYVCKTVAVNADLLKRQKRDVPREYEIWSNLGTHPYILACEDFQYGVNERSLDHATYWSKYCKNGDLALVYIHYGLHITMDEAGGIENLDFNSHATLIHRDIKPQNIFISSLDPMHVKIGDFGCAKPLDDNSTMSDTGTERYKAPMHNDFRYLERHN